MKQWKPGALLEITSTCLTYLCFDAFKSGGRATDEEFEDRLRESKFLGYAAKHWGEHAFTVQGEACGQICSFFLHEGSISSASQVLSTSDHKSKFESYSQHYPKETTGLHLTARFGLSLISEKILPCEVHKVLIAVSSKDSSDQTPLYLAAEHGHFEMAKLLLDKGSDFYAQRGLNALTEASDKGHKQIVRLLPDNSADVNAQVGFDGNTLIAAVSGGNEQIVKLLLDNGADPNTQGGFHSNALIAASYKGNEQMVRLLLDEGADPNTQVGYYGNALIAASDGGNEQIVKLLLDNGADINARGGYIGNALRAAGGSGRVELVKLLLEAGADPKSFDCVYGSFLNFLAFIGHTELLRLIYDQYYGTPLLLNSHGRTPLQLAARGGHLDAFQYLLSLGFDPAVTDEKGENLLHYASSGGSLDILDAVLHMDFVSHTKSEHWSPIHWACRNGNFLLVERLIKKGIQSDSVTVPKPEGQWSPSSIAIFHGKGEMLKELSEQSMSLLDTGEDAVRLHGVPHANFRCDGCFHGIYGPRFHCRTCSDFDYCFMCNPFLSHLHGDHEWDCFEPLMED